MDKFEALKQYKELLDSGIISQEVFDEKKSQLLGLKKSAVVSEEATETFDAGTEIKEEDWKPADDQPQTDEPAAVVSGKKSRKNNKTLIVLIAAGVIAIAVLLGILFAGRNGSSDVSQPDSTAAAGAGSIDYVEPAKVVKSFKLSDAVVNLTQDWEYDRNDSDGVSELYHIYVNDKDDAGKVDHVFVQGMFNVINGATDAEQVKSYYDTFVPSLLGAYKGAEVKTQEHITRDGHPAYHLEFYVPEAKVTYTIYLFMANEKDMIMAMKAHVDDATTDNSADFMEIVRSIRTSDSVI